MKVFITKYALSTGIVEAELLASGDGGFITVAWPDGVGDKNYFGRGDWCETEDQAIGRAKVMRLAKIQSLEKQIRKLRDLHFESKQRGKP